ncbi:MAG TPA: thiolase family protein [Acidimicrobiia bacterium]|nr:thiolase family protein [Acidimicrobiia bacterium]
MPNSLHRVAIAGVGFSETGRRLPYSDDEMVRQAVTAAMDDAGMNPADIDGVGTMGGNAMAIGHLLGITPINYFFTSSMMAPAFVEPAIMSISAVASGLSHTCVAVRLIRQMPGASDRAAAAPKSGPPPIPEPMRAVGDASFSAPFGIGAAAAGIGGFQMQRYLSEFGATEEDFARNAVNARWHASMNEDALFRDELTVDDYLASRYISKPLRLLDCDYPCDSASAVIFTTEERAPDFRQKPVMVESYALSAIRDFDMSLLEDFVRNAPVHCAEALWSRTDLKPTDVDCAQLYDGFSVITFEWLEALGFCGFGEAGGFIADGNTRLGGSLPLNTDGGACNVGRRHGANFCIEATRQIRGQSGERQVDGAEVAVWSNAVGPFAGAVLLTA